MPARATTAQSRSFVGNPPTFHVLICLILLNYSSFSTRTPLRAHFDQVPLNYPSETVVKPSSTAHFHYGFPTVEPLSRYSNKMLSSNLKTAIFQPCKRCHTA